MKCSDVGIAKRDGDDSDISRAAIVVLSNLLSALRCDGRTMRRFIMGFAAKK